MGLPYGKLSLLDIIKGELRAYHVSCKRLSGVGLAFLPVAQHLRQVINQHPTLTTYLLVQAFAR